MEDAATRPSGSSLAIQSDGSDFEFSPWEVFGDEAPVSPKLHTLSPSWEQLSISNSLVSPTHAGVRRHSLDAIEITPNKKVSLRSLFLEREKIHHLPLVAGTRNRSAPEKTASAFFRRSRPSGLESSPPSTPVLPQSGSPHKKRRNRWSFSLNPSHAKPVCTLNGLHDCHHAVLSVAQKIDTARGHDNSCYSPQKSPCRSSASSISSSTPANDREKDLLPRTASKKMGLTTISQHSVSALVSPTASPSRTTAAGCQSVETQAAAPRTSAPMSPHAQHYQRQRARAQQLSRRTSLPYRQNLLTSCFFPSSPLVPSY